LTATGWDYEEFVQPGDEPAVLQSPCVGQDGDADGLWVVGEEDRAAPGIREHAHDRFREFLQTQSDAVVPKLIAKERDDRARVVLKRRMDAHVAGTGARPLGFEVRGATPGRLCSWWEQSSLSSLARDCTG
jgi:hypothetical protein